MFIDLLRFSENRQMAGDFMAGHNDWLQRGFDKGVFLMAGSLQPAQGGALLAHDVTLAELEHRIEADPFVTNKVVQAEILEITPSSADERLNFLLP